jgi:hypothetical protein
MEKGTLEVAGKRRGRYCRSMEMTVAGFPTTHQEGLTLYTKDRPSELSGGMTSCMTGALSGRYSLTGRARTAYVDSDLVDGPDGSVLDARGGTGDVGGIGMGNGNIRVAMRMNRS